MIDKYNKFSWNYVFDCGFDLEFMAGIHEDSKNILNSV
jgi:hypothetical protein